MYYVYVLQSQKDNSLYTGFTANVKERLASHNSGKNISTKNKRPWKLIYFESYIEKKDAENRELFLKSGSGKKFLDKQLKEYFKKFPRKKLNKFNPLNPHPYSKVSHQQPNTRAAIAAD